MIKYYLELIWNCIGAVVKGLSMLISICLRPLWMLVAGVMGFRRGELRKPVIVAIALVVLAGSVMSIVSVVRGPQINIELGPYESLGEATAEETARLVNDSGQIVVWIFEMGRAHPENECVLSHFRRSLRKHPKIRLVDVERFRPQADTPDARSFFSTDTFRELLGKHPQVDAIVSFAGMPALGREDLRTLSASRPKIISVDYLFDPINLPAQIKNDVVQVAIVRRSSPPGALSESASSRERFEHYFEVLRR